MNVNAVISLYNKTIKEIGGDPKDFVLSAGAALVLLGVRETTSDLDIDVSNEIFDDIAILPYQKVLLEKTEVIKYNSQIDLIRTENKKTKIIKGCYCYTIEELIKQKQKLLKQEKRTKQKKEQDKKDLDKLMQL